MKNNTLVSSLVIIVVVPLLVSALFGMKVFAIPEEKIQDRFFTRHPAPSNIVILAIDNESLEKIGQWPWKRSVFADVIHALPQARAIGFDVHFSEPSRYTNSDDSVLASALAESIPKVVLANEIRNDSIVAVRPLPIFENVTEQGFVQVPLDSDGVARRVNTKKGNFQSFDAMLRSSATEEHQENANIDPVRIAYYGPEKTFPTFSVHELLSGSVPDSAFEGATVLVGATTPSLHDTLQTPFGIMSGVEVHANILATLLRGQQYKEVTPLLAIILIFGSTFLTAILTYLFRRKLIFILLIQIVVLSGILLGAIISFSHFQRIPFFYMGISVVLTAVSLLALLYVHASRERAFIRKSFQYYLMPEVIDELVKDPKKLSLGGEKKKVTILFSDIRNFTSLSETLSPEELTQFINEYLTAMTDIIMRRGGLVDKYIGDAIMAFWGAPLNNKEQAFQAVEAFKDMQAALKELNATWAKRNLPHVAIGVGIHTGDAVVGNMGSTMRFNYTLMGDNVNFTSRLESLTKFYGVGCLIGETTAFEVEEKDISTYEVDEVRVKGKKESRKIFALIEEGLTPDHYKAYDYFIAGYKAYQNGSFTEAVKLFEKTIAMGVEEPHGPAQVLRNRSISLLGQGVSDWDGIYNHTGK